VESPREFVREPRRERSDAPRVEGRTRDVDEDRTPADLEQSKRRPRRDRASVARNQGESNNRPTAQPAPAPVVPASVAPEPEPVIEQAATVPVAPDAFVESALETIAPEASEPIEVEPRPKPAPAVVIVSPIEAAAAAVKQEPERPAGRAANDPREVRKREREARLRQEGVINERSPE
jgi:ribonuclease E